MIYNDFLHKCYEFYKKDWCLARDVKVEDVDEEVGINGECYVSINEFETNEFQDEAYMKLLLDTNDFGRWQQLSKTTPAPGEVGVKVFFDGVHMDTVWVPENKIDVTINSLARYGYDNYNADVKEDWERISGSTRKPKLSFQVMRLVNTKDEVDINRKDLALMLMAKFPDRSVYSEQLIRCCLEEFQRVFEVDTANSSYCCGTLDKLGLMIGRDYRSSDLLFDIAKVFDQEYDPDIWHPQECWEYSIKKVVGEDVFEKAFEEAYCVEKYRVVLTCFDYGCNPYADCHEGLFANENEAQTKARAMATEECASLNGEDGGPAPDVGCFEVDDCANNDFEVRWYSKTPEEREDDCCDIEYVTTYNVYPLMFNEEGSICKYRGFEIKKDEALYNVYKDGTVFGGGDSFLDALMVADDMCLECAKDKTYALEAVHKVPLEVLIKYVDQQQKEKGDIAADEHIVEVAR